VKSRNLGRKNPKKTTHLLQKPSANREKQRAYSKKRRQSMKSREKSAIKRSTLPTTREFFPHKTAQSAQLAVQYDSNAENFVLKTCCNSVFNLISARIIVHKRTFSPKY